MRISGKRRGRKRVYDVERTRQTILNAAETAFAAYGFDGVSVDVIATTSGYNKSLIFQYFGNKLGLYAAVLRKTDDEMRALLLSGFTPWLAADVKVMDAAQFRALLKTTFQAFLDYMMDHPRFARIMNWEQANHWQTIARIASQFDPDDLTRLEAIFDQARDAGLLRPGLDIVFM